LGFVTIAFLMSLPVLLWWLLPAILY